MSKQPVCSGAEAVKAFRKLGYDVDHQTGSHIILRQALTPVVDVARDPRWGRVCKRRTKSAAERFARVATRATLQGHV